MRQYKRQILDFFHHRFVRDTATLEVGHFASVGIGIAASIIFARILQPQLYGVYSLTFALAGLIMMFTNLGVVQGTLTKLAESFTRREKGAIRDIIAFYLKVSLTVGLLVTIIGFSLAPFLARSLYNNIEIGYLARFILLAGFLSSFFVLLTTILQVIRRIKTLTIIENTEKISKSLLAVLLVAVGLGVFGIVISHLLIALAALVYSWWLYRRLTKNIPFWPSLKEILLKIPSLPIRKYLTFSLAIALDKNLSKLYYFLPPLILGIFVSEAEVGVFKISFSYVGLSLLLLAPISRLLNVQLPATSIYGKKALLKRFKQVTALSLLITISLAFILGLTAKFLVSFLYGSAYLPALPLIYIMLIYSSLGGLEVGIGSIFRTLNKMKVIILINLILVFFEILLGYLLIKNFGSKGAAWTVTIIFSSTTIISYLAALRTIRNISKTNEIK